MADEIDVCQVCNVETEVLNDGICENCEEMLHNEYLCHSDETNTDENGIDTKTCQICDTKCKQTKNGICKSCERVMMDDMKSNSTVKSMHERDSYDVLFRAWSLYCGYLKIYIEMIGKPTSEYIKINDPISIQAKKDAMIENDITEDVEAYDEFNKGIERRGVYVQYISDITR